MGTSVPVYSCLSRLSKRFLLQFNLMFPRAALHFKIKPSSARVSIIQVAKFTTYNTCLNNTIHVRRLT